MSYKHAREMKVECPACKSPVGKKCYFPISTGLTTIFHDARRNLADELIPFRAKSTYLPQFLEKK